MPGPSPEELRKRKIIGINAETVTDVTSTDFPFHYWGEDFSWDIDQFRNGVSVKFVKNEAYDTVFSLIGIDASVANAIRRILLAEIPTLAIENVEISQNTSIVQDEVLAHRLGLVPLKGATRGLRWLKWRHKVTEDNAHADVPQDFNTVRLSLKVKCEWKPDGKKKAKEGVEDPFQLYENPHVYAKQLVFQPTGDQASYFSEPAPIAPIHPDILLAKMRPDEEIDLECLAILGTGADHAKFSPVATASYRLLPTIDINQPILGEDARKFARCFPKGVIGLTEVTAQEAAQEGSGYEGQQGELKAYVKDTMRDTVSRECLRHDEFKNKVKLGRQRDHFIFSVESTGQWESDELVLDAVRILKTKCERMKRGLAQMREYG